MKLPTTALGSLLVFLAGCGSSNPPPAPPAPFDPAPTSATSTPAPTPPVASSAPSAEDKEKAEDKKELDADRAKWQAAHKQELARWTPELRAKAKALAETSFPSGEAAIKAVLASPHRRPGNAARDKYRHPAEMMKFFGFKPNMTVLEIGPGEGWFSEILAPALAKNGKYMATNFDTKGPPDLRQTFYGERFTGFLESSPEAYGKVQSVLIENTKAVLGLDTPVPDSSVDMVLVLRIFHNMVKYHALDYWLAEMHRVLKPGGVLGVEDHRAKPDANPDEVAPKGYLPEAWTIEQVKKAGFELAGKSEINANPKDTKDYPEGVWVLPPEMRNGEKDKDKYLAIGESDRFTLKFVKKKDGGPAKGTPKANDAAPPKKDTSGKK